MTKTTTTVKKTTTTKAGTKVAQTKRAPRGAQQSKGVAVDPFKEKQGQQIAVGGTAKAPIVIDVVPAASYAPRTVKEERYPFSELENSRLVDGVLMGPRFFIPNTDTPNRHLATARKRHRPDQNRFPVAKFNSRKGKNIVGGVEVPGVWVWRAALDEEQAWIDDVTKGLVPA